MRDESFDAAPGPVRHRSDGTGGGVARLNDGHRHSHDDLHEHDHDHDHHGVRVEPAAPTVPSRAVVINVGEHTGALVLASDEQRAGIEVEIHPVSRPDERTHVWVLPREGRDGVVYAAIFPSLESGAYVILDVDGSVSDVVLVPPNQVTHATWM